MLLIVAYASKVTSRASVPTHSHNDNGKVEIVAWVATFPGQSPRDTSRSMYALGLVATTSALLVVGFSRTRPTARRNARRDYPGGLQPQRAPDWDTTSSRTRLLTWEGPLAIIIVRDFARRLNCRFTNMSVRRVENTSREFGSSLILLLPSVSNAEEALSSSCRHLPLCSREPAGM